MALPIRLLSPQYTSHHTFQQGVHVLTKHSALYLVGLFCLLMAFSSYYFFGIPEISERDGTFALVQTAGKTAHDSCKQTYAAGRD